MKGEGMSEEEKKRIEVKTIETKGASSLVEFVKDDRVFRVFVPKGKIKDDTCDPDVLEKGTPYGVPWEDLLDLSDVSPETIAQELRARGIWTADDLLQHDRVLIRIATTILAEPIFAAMKRAERKKRR